MAARRVCQPFRNFIFFYCPIDGERFNHPKGAVCTKFEFDRKKITVRYLRSVPLPICYAVE